MYTTTEDFCYRRDINGGSLSYESVEKADELASSMPEKTFRRSTFSQAGFPGKVCYICSV